MNMRTLTKIVAAGAMGGLFSFASTSNADAHWYRHHHHHCCGTSPYFTRYVGAGHVSYPVYRIDHYKIDYRSPTMVYEGGCCFLW